LALEVKLRRVDHRELSDTERDTALGEFEELSQLSGRYREGDRAATIKGLREFEEKHPRSTWLPVTRDLLVKAKYEQETLASLSDEQLKVVLVQLISRWQSIAVADSPERLEPLRITFSELVRTQRGELLSLTKDHDASIRAISVFCFAFSEDTDDRRILTDAFKDDDGLVRAWAVYGLAERADPETEPAVLAAALEDDESRVRQRACMAIKACIGPDSFDRRRFAERLLGVLESDPQEEVRAFAASALTRLARKADVAELRRLAEQEQAAVVRDLLKQLIEHLENVPGENGS
jgi:hypothetical protein